MAGHARGVDELLPCTDSGGRDALWLVQRALRPPTQLIPCVSAGPPLQVRVDKVAAVPLDGQAAEAGAPSGALGAEVTLSLAHAEVLNATRGDIDFSVFLGDSNTVPSASGETCPADYHARAPAAAPRSSTLGSHPAAVCLLYAALVGMLGAVLL